MTKDDKGNEISMLSKEGKELFDYQLEEGDVIVPLKPSVYTKSQKFYEDGIQKKFPKHTLLVSHKEFGEVFLSVNLEIKKTLEQLDKEGEEIVGKPFKSYIRTNMVGNKVMSIGLFDESRIKKD